MYKKKEKKYSIKTKFHFQQGPKKIVFSVSIERKAKKGSNENKNNFFKNSAIVFLSKLKFDTYMVNMN